MRIIILPHANFRLKERKIPVVLVYKAVAKPDKVAVDRTNPNRFIAKKIIATKSKSYLLLVVYEKTKQAIVVVTIISTSKIHKYF